MIYVIVFFQAEDGIRDLVRSRGLGDVYKRQAIDSDLSEAMTIIGDFISSLIVLINGDSNKRAINLSLIHI